MPRSRPLAAALAALLCSAPTLAFAQGVKAGVVTMLQGYVTAARTPLPQPVALRFKDDVFVRDRIATGDRALARLLLGGKAVVTVRERSVLTIIEAPGRSTVNLRSGKIALSVAQERMAPGETVEIRTPNAIAAVRGTVVIAQVRQITAQAGDEPAPGAAESLFWTLKGLAATFELDAAGGVSPAQPLPAGQRYQRLGLAPGGSTPMAPGEAQAVVADLQTTEKSYVPGATREQVDAEVAQASTLAGVIGDPFGIIQTIEPPSGVTEAPINPPGNLIGGNESGAGNGGGGNGGGGNGGGGNGGGPPQLQNLGFETGDFTGWKLTQEGEDVPGAVLQAFGPVKPAEGKFFALIHTGPGAIDAGEGCREGSACRVTTLSQGFDVHSLVLVRGRATLLSNEFPKFTDPESEQKEFNDAFVVRVVDAKDHAVDVFRTTVNEQHEKFVPAEKAIGDAGFFLNRGSGIADLGEFSKAIVLAPGPATLEASIADVSDNAFASAVALDAFEVTEDPPLYFVRDGESLVGPGREPLVGLGAGRYTFDSLLVVCCGSSASLAGPLLDATEADLAVPFSLAGAIQGGTLTSSWDGPLVRLRGGDHVLGEAVGIFDVWGINTAVDPDTGLTLGTDRPLRHAGAFLQATESTIATRTVMQLDTALLEASRPLIELRAGSRLTTQEAALELSYRGAMTSLGPLVALDASTLRSGGPLIDVNGGVFQGSGSLVRLANGSTLTALAFARVNGGVFRWTGPLATFSGAGNRISLTNSFCATGSCVTAGGLTFALRGGAQASSIAVTNPKLWAGAGSVKLATNGAHFLVSGPSSRIRIQ